MKRYLNSVRQLKNPRSFWKEYYDRKKNDYAEYQSVSLKGGYRVLVPTSLMSAFDEVFLREVYAGNFKIKPDSTIIDIGANVGYFALYAYKHYKPQRLIAFEPMPFNCELLEKHRDLNGINTLEIVQKAVASDAVSIQIGYNESVDFSVGASVLQRSASDQTLEVKAISLYDLLNEYQVEVCELLKVDCEGAEYDILLNASSESYERINAIVIELHDWVPKEIGVPNDLKNKLESNGFQVYIRKDEILFANKN